MIQEYTFLMLKPDAIKRNITGKIISYFESRGLKIVAQKMIILTKNTAANLYVQHKLKVFYNNLINYIVSGPVILQVLKGEDAVLKSRTIIGDTNPVNAKVGTIRKDFGKTLEENTIHSSDTVENAIKEISLFFNSQDIVE